MTIVDRLQRLLHEGRDDALLRFGLGSALINEKSYAEAAPHLEACILMEPGYAAAYKLLGRCYIRLKLPEKARQVYEAGLPVAREKGDKQTEKEILVFLKKLES